ncbi:MAG: hypothetical protein AAFR65_01030 [Pseudomonadota bacterium]
MSKNAYYRTDITDSRLDEKIKKSHLKIFIPTAAIFSIFGFLVSHMITLHNTNNSLVAENVANTFYIQRQKDIENAIIEFEKEKNNNIVLFTKQTADAIKKFNGRAEAQQQKIDMLNSEAAALQERIDALATNIANGALTPEDRQMIANVVLLQAESEISKIQDALDQEQTQNWPLAIRCAYPDDRSNTMFFHLAHLPPNNSSKRLARYRISGRGTANFHDVIFNLDSGKITSYGGVSLQGRLPDCRVGMSLDNIIERGDAFGSVSIAASPNFSLQ